MENNLFGIESNKREQNERKTQGTTLKCNHRRILKKFE